MAHIQNNNPFCIDDKTTPDIPPTYKLHPKYIPDGIDQCAIVQEQERAFRSIRKLRTKEILEKYKIIIENYILELKNTNYFGNGKSIENKDTKENYIMGQKDSINAIKHDNVLEQRSNNEFLNFCENQHINKNLNENTIEGQRQIDTNKKNLFEKNALYLRNIDCTKTEYTMHDKIDMLSNILKENNFEDTNLLDDVLELRKLYIYEKQRAYKERIYKIIQENLPIDKITSAINYRNDHTSLLNDAIIMENIEKRYEQQEKRKEKAKRIDFCKSVVDGYNKMIEKEKAKSERIEKVYKTIFDICQNLERDEQKRIEKETKEKMKVLKMTDEQGYNNFIKENRENRINYILAKTDEYIDEISKKIRMQTGGFYQINQNDMQENLQDKNETDNTLNRKNSFICNGEEFMETNNRNLSQEHNENNIDDGHDHIKKYKYNNDDKSYTDKFKLSNAIILPCYENVIAEKNKIDYEEILNENKTKEHDKNNSVTYSTTEVNENNNNFNLHTTFLSNYEKVVVQPKNLNLTLKDYQIKGVEWLVNLYNNKLNGILADEMGLGKTVQTIGFISYLQENKGINGPFLIVVPLSTISNWSNEFKRWNPSLRCIEYKGTPETRKSLQIIIKENKMNTIITTYEYILKDKNFLSKMNWHYLIVDEGHRLKNKESKLGVIFNTKYNSRYRLILTGTPLQNSLPELWSILNFVVPQIFNSLSNFEDWFNAPLSYANEKFLITEEEKELIIKRLHKILRPFLLRRLKKDVAKDLPEKIERVLKVRMSKLQRIIYDEIKKKNMIKCAMKDDEENETHYNKNMLSEKQVHENDVENTTNLVDENKTSIKSTNEINSEDKNKTSENKIINYEKITIATLGNGINGYDRKFEENNRSHVTINNQNIGSVLEGISSTNNGLMQLRKICNHPFIFEEVEKKINPHGYNNELLYTLSGKFELLNNILPKLKATKHRILMFFQMTQIMTIMEDFLIMKDYKYLRLDGNKRSEERAVLIDNFNNDHSYFIFLLSTRAGGLGINLTSADTVIIFDSDWNPHADLQAQDRAHRIGQKNEVRIFRLVTVDSIEEYMLERAIMKLDLDTKIIQAGKFDQKYISNDEEIPIQDNNKHQINNNENKLENNKKIDQDEINKFIARDEEEYELFKNFDKQSNDLTLNLVDDFGIYNWDDITTNEINKVYENENNFLSYKSIHDFHSTVKMDHNIKNHPTVTHENDPYRTRQELNRRLTLDQNIISDLDYENTNDYNGFTDEYDNLQSSNLNYEQKYQNKYIDNNINIKQSTKNQYRSNKKIEETINTGKDEFRVKEKLFNTVLNSYDLKRSRIAIFMDLPSKKNYPDYYETIKNPISMNIIKKKIRNSNYTFAMLKQDFLLMFNNAINYNIEGSVIYEDACYLSQLVIDACKDIK
ncbi:ATP-dependent DNA helicase Snf21 [Conglomerata obtusa]